MVKRSGRTLGVRARTPLAGKEDGMVAKHSIVAAFSAWRIAIAVRLLQIALLAARTASDKRGATLFKATLLR
jgi:hypothetical protein